MPDFISRKKLKKKVIDRWENEGGNLSPYERKLTEIKLPPVRKQKKEGQPRLAERSSL